jgi:hypothetical protein
LADFSSGWSSLLTSGQRAAWSAFAETQGALNRLGEAITLTGQQSYVRSNTLLLLAGQGAVTAPPSITAPSISVADGTVASLDVSDNELSVTLNVVVTGFMLAFCGPPQSAGASSLKVPFRFYGVDSFSATSAIVIPASVGSRTFTAGQRMACRFVLVTSTGGVSNQLLLRGESVA